MPEQLFMFIQLEFPWALGPADGRYLLRRRDDGEPEHVVVLGTLGAARQLGSGASARGGPTLRRRRARSVASGPEPEPVPTTRVTVIDPVSLSAEQPGARMAGGARPRARGRCRGERRSTASSTPTASPRQTPTCTRSPRAQALVD